MLSHQINTVDDPENNSTGSEAHHNLDFMNKCPNRIEVSHSVLAQLHNFGSLLTDFEDGSNGIPVMIMRIEEFDVEINMAEELNGRDDLMRMFY
mmetsp:Transcript_24955/g.38762  ORF Transcript_24955/g.38762 Transcript_24955/m.38762 type:complete len:94 (+) Transcript_24955:343-624(+)|eukprot:CAMPEP_0170495452 /NCGR_PEP_ID=MMETSP0208-20121228/16036_1 /TAXON_ID=197538 /ORGANISM="Strombidium inclinatum, Strain S3" /LENGTH=93 /DNA_ID=CAMNT_0010771683 /DNA_START=830 /DNA_END=1111 /DNA_ORIENTATION=-